MSVEERVKKLGEVVELQAILIEQLADALSDHDLGGPHYMDIHALKDRVANYKRVAGAER